MPQAEANPLSLQGHFYDPGQLKVRPYVSDRDRDFEVLRGQLQVREAGQLLIETLLKHEADLRNVPVARLAKVDSLAASYHKAHEVPAWLETLGDRLGRAVEPTAFWNFWSHLEDGQRSWFQQALLHPILMVGEAEVRTELELLGVRAVTHYANEVVRVADYFEQIRSEIGERAGQQMEEYDSQEERALHQLPEDDYPMAAEILAEMRRKEDKKDSEGEKAPPDQESTLGSGLRALLSLAGRKARAAAAKEVVPKDAEPDVENDE
jgi:hypothetical protein